jgi:hypothetical protein
MARLTKVDDGLSALIQPPTLFIQLLTVQSLLALGVILAAALNPRYSKHTEMSDNLEGNWWKVPLYMFRVDKTNCL